MGYFSQAIKVSGRATLWSESVYERTIRYSERNVLNFVQGRVLNLNRVRYRSRRASHVGQQLRPSASVTCSSQSVCLPSCRAGSWKQRRNLGACRVVGFKHEIWAQFCPSEINRQTTSSSRVSREARSICREKSIPSPIQTSISFDGRDDLI